MPLSEGAGCSDRNLAAVFLKLKKQVMGRGLVLWTCVCNICRRYHRHPPHMCNTGPSKKVFGHQLAASAGADASCRDRPPCMLKVGAYQASLSLVGASVAGRGYTREAQTPPWDTHESFAHVVQSLQLSLKLFSRKKKGRSLPGSLGAPATLGE